MSEGITHKEILDRHDAQHGFGPLAKKKKAVAHKMAAHKARRLTLAEQREKTKNWPKAEPNREAGMKAQMARTEENMEYQRRHGRAWND